MGLYFLVPKVRTSFYNASSNKTVVVPVHGNRDLKKGTFLAILKQAGIDKNDL
jgi:predicted RNA binding protein YcfA (HicA-like mRNA interferase family)